MQTALQTWMAARHAEHDVADAKLEQDLRAMTQQRDQANTNAANVERELAVARARLAKVQRQPHTR